MDEATVHKTVLLEEAVAALVDSSRTGLFLDGTFGGGGHTRRILDANPENRVLALDCDPDAIQRGMVLAEKYPGRLKIADLNFRNLGTIAPEKFAGALFDFGVSSWHLDTPERGFSFRFSGPLDMRLNPREGMTAAEFLEKADYPELVRAIRDFGEEPRWRVVVRALQDARAAGDIYDTARLANRIAEVAGNKNPRIRSALHPATRSFQGIRIAINDELEAIEEVLPVAFKLLQPGGRLVAISFHSLEDRIVKRFFRKMAGRPEHGRDNRPQQERKILGKELTRKPVVPSEEEAAINPRARSARMRIIEKGEQSL